MLKIVCKRLWGSAPLNLGERLEKEAHIAKFRVRPGIGTLLKCCEETFFDSVLIQGFSLVALHTVDIPLPLD